MTQPTRAEFIAQIEEEGYAKHDRWKNQPKESQQFFKDREYVWMHEEGMSEWQVHTTFATHWDWVENKATKTVRFKPE